MGDRSETLMPSFLIILAGTPDTTQLSGISFTTTEFGATMTLLPIDTLPITLQPTVNDS